MQLVAAGRPPAAVLAMGGGVDLVVGGGGGQQQVGGGGERLLVFALLEQVGLTPRVPGAWPPLKLQLPSRAGPQL